MKEEIKNEFCKTEWTDKGNDIWNNIDVVFSVFLCSKVLSSWYGNCCSQKIAEYTTPKYST